MFKLIREGSAVALTLAAFATPAAAQRVAARVVVARGPVVADVRLGSTYVPPYHEVYVTRYVDRDDFPGRGRGRRWYRPADFQRVIIYVGRDGRYYDRWDDRLVGLHAVAVYQREGRYYWDDGRFRDDDRHDGRYSRGDRRDDDRRDRGDHDRRWHD